MAKTTMAEITGNQTLLETEVTDQLINWLLKLFSRPLTEPPQVIIINFY